MDFANEVTMLHPPNNSIAVDIDGTLIVDGAINARVLSFCIARRETHCLTLWSSRGEDYARRIAEHHKVDHIFHHITGKPSHIIDDQGWSWVKFTKVTHPANIIAPISQSQ